MTTAKSAAFVIAVAAVASTMGFVPAAGVAGATSARSTTPARPAPAATSGKGAIVASPHAASAPKGYAIVNSGTLDNPAASESYGSATCPAGTVVWGGGVTSSGGLEQTVNSSWPSTTQWQVYIDDSGSSDDTFAVYAVCAKAPKKYAVESVSAASPSGEQTLVRAPCPAKTVVLGGGAYSQFIGISYTINSTYPPASHEWDSEMNNSGNTDSVTNYAICGKKPKGYVVETGSITDNPPGQDSPAIATCPSAKTSILSAGVLSSAPESETDVSVNELVAHGGAVAYEANASANDHTINVYAVCAK